MKWIVLMKHWIKSLLPLGQFELDELRTVHFVTGYYLCTFRKLRNTSDGAERVMDTMQQMARSFSTRLVQMGMAYESTVESADNRKIFQNFVLYFFIESCRKL